MDKFTAIRIHKRQVKLYPVLFMGCFLTVFLAGCGSPAPTETTGPVNTPLIEAVLPSATYTPSPPATIAPTATPTPEPTSTPSLTLSPTPTETPTPSITPTYAILRAKVLEQANCRYGPGAPYLYKYGLFPPSNIEVFGRTERGDWLLIRAIGGTNPCWVKASLLEVRGEVMSVQPTYIPLPQSPYYGPVSGVAAVREGDEVTISWDAWYLRPGDDHASPTFLVEAYVCQGGEIVFTPIGTDAFLANVIDEAGCEEPSFARVYGVEKHGYTRWVEIPMPGRE